MNINRIKYIATTLLASAAVMYGCSGGQEPEDPAPSGEGGAAAIGFRSLSETAGGPTRAAAADFPNTSIGISATYDGFENDWRRYGDIMNEKATVADTTGNLFAFRWQNPKYWPFDGADLIFAAYSPHTSDAPGVLELDYDLKRLYITLADVMPDVMYASGNEALTAYNKGHKVADLGEFRHALSRLTVIVTADANINPVVTLGGLSVGTTKGKATLDLLTDGELGFGAAAPFSYDLVTSAAIPFSQNNPYSATVYLFPGTEDDTTVTVTLNDSSYTFDASFVLSDIMFDKALPTDPDVPLNLVRASNTTVTLTVTGTSVQNPDKDIQLQGQLTDWDYRGDLLVTIN